MSVELEHADEVQEAAEVAFGIDQRIKEAMARGRQALWDLAEALYDFDESHGWLALGYEKLSDYLADPEVTLTLGTYRRYVRTYRKLVVEKAIPVTRLRELEQSKVAIVVDKVANNEVLVEDALADVEALGAKDLREKYYNRRPTLDEDPATTGPETSGQVLPDEDEPTRADQWDAVERLASEVKIELTAVPFDGPDEGDTIDVEVLDALPADGYDWPAWMTVGGVKKLLENARSGVDSGAAWPRCVTRRDCEVVIELAQAWLAHHQNS